MPQNLRSLGAEARLSAPECRSRLAAGGLSVAVNKQRLAGDVLARARTILGLPRVRPSACEKPPVRRLDEAELLLRLLRPLREKRKLGPTHTTPIENVHAHGVPDHQKGEAQLLVERLLAEGCLAEKPSQQRQHVWLTEQGLRRLSQLEAAA